MFCVVDDATLPGLYAIPIATDPTADGKIELARDISRDALMDGLQSEAMALSTEISDRLFGRPDDPDYLEETHSG